MAKEIYKLTRNHYLHIFFNSLIPFFIDKLNKLLKNFDIYELNSFNVFLIVLKIFSGSLIHCSFQTV